MNIRNIGLYLFLSLFLVSFGFSATGSDGSLLVCCYDGDSFTLDEEDSCEGGISFPYSSDDGGCDSYYSQNYVCMYDAGGSPACSQTYGSHDIYKIDGAYYAGPGGEKTTEIQSWCDEYGGNLVLESGVGSTCEEVSLPVDSETGDVEDGGDNFEDIIDNYVQPEIDEDGDVVASCSSFFNSLFGYYVEEEECEDLRPNGVSEVCIYDPVPGANLFHYGSVVDFDQRSCKAKAEVLECSDYNLQENCEENSAYKYEQLGLADGCVWIPASEYLKDGLFSDVEGMCISNFTSGDTQTPKNYRKYALLSRQNFFENPSFENGIEGWDSAIDGNVDSSTSYHGEKSYVLNSDSFISQTFHDMYFLNLNNRVRYDFYLSYKLKSDMSEGNSAKLRVLVSGVDEDGSQVELGSEILDVDSMEFGDRFYKKSFNSLNLKINKNLINITFKIESVSGDFYIDAVSFELSDPDYVQLGTSNIFKPFTLLDSRASSCQECVETDNFDTCTLEKSNLMGDCEYMVNEYGQQYNIDLDEVPNYVGKEENNYTKSFTSKSLAESLVFCELYLNDSKCTSSDNFVNQMYKSLHPNSGDSLCKWNDEYGCFKDSDNNDLPDVLGGKINVSGNWWNRNWRDYNFSSSSDEFPSDFKYSCDQVPPNAYLYLTASNESGDRNVLEVTDSFDDRLGDVKFYFRLVDLEGMEACENLFGEDYFEHNLYLEYLVGENEGVIDFGSNSVGEAGEYVSGVNLKDLIVDEDGDLIGEVAGSFLVLRVYDQSGNIGKEWNFNFGDLDLYAPELNVTNPGFVEEELGSSYVLKTGGNSVILTGNENLNFSVFDDSYLKSCEYRIESLGGYGGSEWSYNDSVQTVDVGTENTSLDFEVNFMELIFESGPSTVQAELNVDCRDIFNQSVEKNYILNLDFNTDIVVLEPESYISWEDEKGFLNSTTDFWAVSTDANLESCSLYFGSDLSTNQDLGVSPVPEDYSVSGIPNIKKNVTGQIGFNADGNYSGRIVCQDIRGNEISEDLIYYYDTQKPTLDSFSLVGEEKVYFDEETGIWYTNSREDQTLKLHVDATGTWVSELDVSLSIGGSEIEEFTTSAEYANKSNDETIDNLTISGFDFDGGPLMNIVEDNLSNVSPSVVFRDKAGNYETSQVSYRVDDSSPSLVLSGNDVHMKKGTDEVYVSSARPDFNLSFNAPSYRKFDCNVSLVGDRRRPQNIGYSNLITFNPVDVLKIRGGFDKGSNKVLNFSCRDVYGLEFGRNFEVIYDNVTPVLNGIEISYGSMKNDFYQPSDPEIKEEGDSMGYQSDLIADIKFDVDESDVTCRYEFEPLTSNIDCVDEDVSKFQELSNYLITERMLVDFGEDAPISYGHRCIRNDDETPVNISINVTGQCRDFAGHYTEEVSQVVNLYFVDSIYKSLTFNYSNGDVCPVVETIYPISSVGIYKEANLDEDSLIEDKRESKVYEFRCFDPGIEGYSVGEHDLWASSTDFSQSFWGAESIKSKFVYDISDPFLEAKVPGYNEGKVYGKNFVVDFEAKDTLYMDRVEFYVGNKLVYDTSNPEGYSQSYFTQEPSGIHISDKEIKGDLFFSNGFEIGDSVNLEVRSYNRAGLFEDKIISFTIADGIAFILEDSENAKVSPTNQYKWYTNGQKPILKFSASSAVESCDFFPLEDDSSVSIELINGPNFDAVDMSQFDSFSLTRDNFSKTVNVSCQYVNSEGVLDYFTNGFIVEYVESLPDYVLESSNGFFFNEEPYETEIDIFSVSIPEFIECDLSVDGNGIDLPISAQRSFSTFLNLSEIDGEVPMVLQCYDIFGTPGPRKEYTLNVIQEAQLEIRNVEVELDGGKIVEADDSNTFYLDRRDGMYLNIELNKKQGVSCSYDLGGLTPIGRILDFLGDIFGVGRVDTGDSIDYNSYVVSGDTSLSLGDADEYEMEVTCRDGETDSVEEVYTIKYTNSSEVDARTELVY